MKLFWLKLKSKTPNETSFIQGSKSHVNVNWITESTFHKWLIVSTLYMILYVFIYIYNKSSVSRLNRFENKKDGTQLKIQNIFLKSLGIFRHFYIVIGITANISQWLVIIDKNAYFHIFVLHLKTDSSLLRLACPHPISFETCLPL